MSFFINKLSLDIKNIEVSDFSDFKDLIAFCCLAPILSMSLILMSLYEKFDNIYMRV